MADVTQAVSCGLIPYHANKEKVEKNDGHRIICSTHITYAYKKVRSRVTQAIKQFRKCVGSEGNDSRHPNIISR
jgi:hypothetical protein